MPLRLIIEDDEGSTTVVPLASEAITIGRQQGNTIQLTEKNVSRQHARLYPESDGWIIEDLGSYNGVKVGSNVVEGRTMLREGDVVEIGDYHLAITEDVDKSPLNFRSGQAANNGGAQEPMLVSSSTDLPQLSVDDIASLQAGQPPVPTPAHYMVDSGPISGGLAYTESYEEPRSQAGVWLLVGLFLFMALGLGAFLVLQPSSPDGSTELSQASVSPTDVRPPMLSPVPAEPDQPPSTPVEPEPELGTDPSPAGTVGDQAPAEPALQAPSAAPAEATPAPETPPETSAPKPKATPTPPTGVNKPRAKPQPPKASKPEPKPKPKPKPKPAVDVDQLINEARQKQYKEPANAYRLAKQAYGAKASNTALWVMGPAACRMNDKSKALWVLKRLKGVDKTKLKDICTEKGLEL